MCRTDPIYPGNAVRTRNRRKSRIRPLGELRSVSSIPRNKADSHSRSGSSFEPWPFEPRENDSLRPLASLPATSVLAIHRQYYTCKRYKTALVPPCLFNIPYWNSIPSAVFAMVYSAYPQRLKPEPVAAPGGTAEAVPYPFSVPSTATQGML
jgi:hypothetical protein